MYILISVCQYFDFVLPLSPRLCFLYVSGCIKNGCLEKNGIINHVLKVGPLNVSFTLNSLNQCIPNILAPRPNF
jgi:hypothetical protein